MSVFRMCGPGIDLVPCAGYRTLRVAGVLTFRCAGVEKSGYRTLRVAGVLTFRCAGVEKSVF